MKTQARNSQSDQNYLKQLIGGLPKETVQDLKTLFQELEGDVTQEIHDEIVQTITEILFPSVMNVPVQDEYSLDFESQGARERLTHYRRCVGAEIARCRKEAGLTQDSLAELTGLSQSHICRLETGVHVPTFDTIEKIAFALNVKPCQLDPGFKDDFEDK